MKNVLTLAVLLALGGCAIEPAFACTPGIDIVSVASVTVVVVVVIAVGKAFEYAIRNCWR